MKIYERKNDWNCSTYIQAGCLPFATLFLYNLFLQQIWQNKCYDYAWFRINTTANSLKLFVFHIYAVIPILLLDYHTGNTHVLHSYLLHGLGTEHIYALRYILLARYWNIYSLLSIVCAMPLCYTIYFINRYWKYLCSCIYFFC